MCSPKNIAPACLSGSNPSSNLCRWCYLRLPLPDLVNDVLYTLATWLKLSFDGLFVLFDCAFSWHFFVASLRLFRETLHDGAIHVAMKLCVVFTWSKVQQVLQRSSCTWDRLWRSYQKFLKIALASPYNLFCSQGLAWDFSPTRVCCKVRSYLVFKYEHAKVHEEHASVFSVRAAGVERIDKRRYKGS